MAKAHSKQNIAQNKAAKTERYYTVGYVPQNDKANAPPAIHLKGQWLKAAGFDIGGTLTVKIMDGCLVLIPDSDDTRSIKQQYQRQQDQLSEIKLRMRELIGEYKNA
ncbi:type I toxin-antitoxin system SymE family toxin [Xenorhabdus bovienii]|uniref:SymE family type I addiction module toxin n=1 Tax=Xenorhabdus bovienii TaxID=40576 RepID=UPI0023B24423|nr:SymE family type I addiction module toxin [Xenorhabdus bovienii]MDE9434278.1 type I toxin-antitoxin system SymE family toxin [Xenorhabdus bovienii]MDE9491917.1 type I toxin-antitoxin system SymE family toxin [Xenorhabdus bovienii]MDE9508326.1 type I toxin-antitoxin system SymE family toxin [Xenorhabdus bovienii]MDE9545253.1 type I toxin-antitoxin system SymE family toxin [Xenorhabdus bovienii]MDE9549374.1 type I toxin-antitoxin system SymE family toxin [Xenorhabdus bovienii]